MHRASALACTSLVAVAALCLAGCGTSSGDDDGAAGDGGSKASAKVTVPPVVATRYQQGGANVAHVHGSVRVDGEPVRGLTVLVGAHRLPAPTTRDGGFDVTVDSTLVERRPVTFADLGKARIGSHHLDHDQRAALEGADAAVQVGYAIDDLAVETSGGSTTLSGVAHFRDGAPVVPVVLYSYRLRGIVTDESGDPLANAVVSTRNADREAWTLSTPTAADGRYDSFFYPGTASGAFDVRVAHRDAAYELPSANTVSFTPLQSERMDARVDTRTGTIRTLTVVPERGAVYEGLFVGVLLDGTPLHVTAATWPDARGRFSITFDAPDGSTVRASDLRTWQAQGYYFSADKAVPGGPVDPDSIPSTPRESDPRGG
jgi:hypothetical protein